MAANCGLSLTSSPTASVAGIIELELDADDDAIVDALDVDDGVDGCAEDVKFERLAPR